MAVGPRDYGECDEPVGIDPDGRLLCDKTKFNPAVPSDIGSIRVGRQPGSSFKPYVTTAALEAGIPPNWTVDATGPATIPGCDNGGPWKVNNAGGDGLRDLYSGIKASSNVFHAKLIKEVGPSKVVDVATRLGVRRSPLPAECSLALGAIEIFPLEHATGYATLANRGVYCAPYAIERIEQADGTPFYEYQPRCERAVDEAIADRVVDILEGPVTPGGTAPHANLGRWPTRGKTGTTNDYRDAWFIGFVKQLATASWMGYENGVTTFESQQAAEAACRNPVNERAQCVETLLMTNVTIGGNSYSRIFGSTITAPMWKQYMEQVVAGFEPQGFPRPGPLPLATVPDFTTLATVAEIQALAQDLRLSVFFEEIEDFRPAGTQIRAGQAVTVLVSDGKGTPPQVPSVIGMLQEDAQQLLLEYGYIVVVKKVNRVNPNLWGRVVGQNPGPGADVPPGGGQKVEIEVAEQPGGGGPEPDETLYPDPDPEPVTEPTNDDEDD
jgi:membrane peptidoglycan carboxypeptidase